MKAKLSVLLFGCLMLVLSPLASKAAASSFIAHGQSNGIAYASGGVGMDERVAMDAMAKDYNVKMMFVEAPKNYVSGVKLKIEDHSGKLLLETTSSGPWFWAKLPQGDYRVIASLHNHREMRHLKVAGGVDTIEFFWKA